MFIYQKRLILLSTFLLLSSMLTTTTSAYALPDSDSLKQTQFTNLIINQAKDFSMVSSTLLPTFSNNTVDAQSKTSYYPLFYQSA